MCTAESEKFIDILLGWWTEFGSSIVSGSEMNSPDEMNMFEKNLYKYVFDLARRLGSTILKDRAEDPAFQKQSYDNLKPQLNGKYKNTMFRHTTVKTRFADSLRLYLRYFWPVSGGEGFFPSAVQLGLTEGETPALSSEVAYEAVKGPSMESTVDALEHHNLQVDVKYVQRSSERFGMTALESRKRWMDSRGTLENPLIPVGETLNGKIVLIGVDGGRIRTRRTKNGRKLKSGRHPYHAEWREPRLMIIRSLDDKGGIVREERPVYDGTLENVDYLFDLLMLHLATRNIAKAQKIVVVGDGAPWIWDRMKPMLDELGVDPSIVYYAVDYFHAVEHLTKVVDEKKTWTVKKRSTWLNAVKDLLYSGDIESVIAEIKVLARGRNSKVFTTEMRYFRKHKDRMRYNLLRDQNLPIGSGAVESAIRQVINMRLKNVGMFWLEKNAEAFLHMRCYLVAKRWNLVENAVFSSSKRGCCNS